MNINRIFKIVIPFILFSSFIFSEDYKVEVGIESITQNDDKYNISVYIINPYVPIAGIQFKIIPSDIFSIDEIYGGKAVDAGFQIHKNKKGIIFILGLSVGGILIHLLATSCITQEINCLKLYCWSEIIDVHKTHQNIEKIFIYKN